MLTQHGHTGQGLASLQAMEHGAERTTQQRRVDRVEDGAHLRIAGDDAHTVDRMQAGGLQDPPAVKIEQGLIFQGKHRKTTHQGVGKGNLDIAGPVIGHLGEVLADGGEQGIAVEMHTHFDLVEGPGGLTVSIDQALEGRHGFSYITLKLHRKNDFALLAMSSKKSCCPKKLT